MELGVRQFRWHEQFHGIPWNLECANFDDMSSSMEFHFRWKGRYATEIQYLNTPSTTLSPSNDATALIDTLWITIALDSSFNLLLMSWLLVDNDGNCQHHVIIGINHGYVCVLLISTPACVVSPCRAIIDIPFLVKCFDCEVSAKFYIASLTIHRYC